MTPKSIILHCSATEDGRTYSWDAIRRYHMETLGWADIGYHAGIELVGDRFVFLRGRPWDQEGAHCKAGGRNSDSLGLCVVGCYDLFSPNDLLMGITARVLAWMCVTAGIDPEHIYGHREFESRKTCPGTAWDLDRTRELVRKLVRHSDLPVLALDL